jgi:hypothetical protein
MDPLQNPYCPEIGSDIGVIFGDIDCNGAPDFGDSLPVLRYASGPQVEHSLGCLPIGGK